MKSYLIAVCLYTITTRFFGACAPAHEFESSASEKIVFKWEEQRTIHVSLAKTSQEVPSYMTKLQALKTATSSAKIDPKLTRNNVSCESRLDTSCQDAQDDILNLVNNVRREAKAANMLKMVWDSDAAAAAQTWADRCVFEHGGHDGCGQNIAAGSSDWEGVFAMWDGEIKDFQYGMDPCPFPQVGHYTQDVWATSGGIGCGYQDCPNLPWGSLWVCNYCPPGNYQPVCKPYLEGNDENGGICGKCGGENSENCEDGLCLELTTEDQDNSETVSVSQA